MDVLGRHELVRDGFSDDLVDLALGARLNLWRNFVVSFNAVTPLNRDTGYRPKATYAFTFDYLF